MYLLLWKNFSKRRNSTKYPTDQPDYNKVVTMKKLTSIEHPVFLLSDVDLEVNYARFADHYYFIDDISLNNDNIYEISCSQDVLATYKGYIGASTQFVERAESGYDANIADNMLSNTPVITNTSHVGTRIGLDDDGVYIFRVVSKTGINNYMMGGFFSSALSTVMETMFTDVGLPDEVTKYFFNPFQYIVSCYWLPISLSESILRVKENNMAWGFWNYDTTSIPIYNIGSENQYKKTVTLSLPTNAYSDFRAYSDNFSQYNLYLPGIGSVHVSASDVKGGLKCSICLDVISGECIYVLTHSDSSVIATYKCQLGVDVQIGQLNSRLGGVASGAAAVGGGLATGNVLTAAAGVVDVMQSYSAPSASILGTAGNISELKQYNQIVLSVKNYGSKDYPTTVAGRPVMKNVHIATLSGYIKCGNPSLDIPGFSGDKEELNSLMASGFYYE